jgi:DNA-binding FadR family transcriptional regulator
VQPRSCWNLFDSRVIEWRVEAGIDEEFIHDLIELRMAIEPAAATIAAKRASPESRARLTARYAAMARAVERPDYRAAYLEADLAFHAEILHATGNQFFVSLAPMIAAVLQVSFRLSVRDRETTRHSLPDHETIARAIADGDDLLAAQTLRDVIGKARRDISIGLTAAENEPGLPRGAAP